MSPPWRDIPERIKAVGDSQDFLLGFKGSFPGLGQGLPRFARNDISAFFGLFTNLSLLAIKITPTAADRPANSSDKPS